MADFTNLKDNIKSKIKSNGKQDITGAVLQEQMIDIVDQMNETFTGELTELESEIGAETRRASNAERSLEVSIEAYKNETSSDVNSFKESITNQVNNYKPIEITGNVTNAADEEDLTAESGLLKLKDRNNLNGLGYVILRKGKTFAEQVTTGNTVYEIRYYFDLNGAEVAIPRGCVLDFRGGSLNNGVITANNTSICAPNNVIFNNVVLKGDFVNGEIQADWFKSIQDAIDVCENENSFNTVKLSNRKYVINAPLLISKGINVIGSKIAYKNSYGYAEIEDLKSTEILQQGNCNIIDIKEKNDLHWLTLQDIVLIGNGKTHHGINSIDNHIQNFVIKNVRIENVNIGLNMYGKSSEMCGYIFDVYGLFITDCYVGINIEAESLRASVPYSWGNGSFFRKFFISCSYCGVKIKNISSMQSCRFEQGEIEPNSNYDYSTLIQTGYQAFNIANAYNGSITISHVYMEHNRPSRINDGIVNEGEIVGSSTTSLSNEYTYDSEKFAIVRVEKTTNMLITVDNSTFSNGIPVKVFNGCIVKVVDNMTVLVKDKSGIFIKEYKNNNSFKNQIITDVPTSMIMLAQTDTTLYTSRTVKYSYYPVNNSTYYIDTTGNEDNTGLSDKMPIPSIKTLNDRFSEGRYSISSLIDNIRLDLNSDILAKDIDISKFNCKRLVINGHENKISTSEVAFCLDVYASSHIEEIVITNLTVELNHSGSVFLYLRKPNIKVYLYNIKFICNPQNTTGVYTTVPVNIKIGSDCSFTSSNLENNIIVSTSADSVINIPNSLSYYSWKPIKYGSYSDRPSTKRKNGAPIQRASIPSGFMYLETNSDITKPIWWSGTKWVDANGADA